jgi:hypothetical protein
MTSLKQRRQVRNSAYPSLGSHEGSIWVRCPYKWHVKALRHAKIRHDRDVRTGDEWRRGMKTNPHYDGLMGEYIIGNLIDLPVDEDDTRRDFKRDFVSRFGLRIDNKNTEKLNIAGVRVRDVQPQAVDIYTFTFTDRLEPNDPYRITEGEFQGWCLWDEFVANAEHHAMRSGPCLQMPIEHLRDPRNLKSYLEAQPEME